MEQDWILTQDEENQGPISAGALVWVLDSVTWSTTHHTKMHDMYCSKLQKNAASTTFS